MLASPYLRASSGLRTWPGLAFSFTRSSRRRDAFGARRRTSSHQTPARPGFIGASHSPPRSNPSSEMVETLIRGQARVPLSPLEVTSCSSGTGRRGSAFESGCSSPALHLVWRVRPKVVQRRQVEGSVPSTPTPRARSGVRGHRLQQGWPRAPKAFNISRSSRPRAGVPAGSGSTGRWAVVFLRQLPCSWRFSISTAHSCIVIAGTTLAFSPLPSSCSSPQRAQRIRWLYYNNGSQTVTRPLSSVALASRRRRVFFGVLLHAQPPRPASRSRPCVQSRAGGPGRTAPLSGRGHGQQQPS